MNMKICKKKWKVSRYFGELPQKKNFEKMSRKSLINEFFLSGFSLNSHLEVTVFFTVYSETSNPLDMLTNGITSLLLCGLFVFLAEFKNHFMRNKSLKPLYCNFIFGIFIFFSLAEFRFQNFSFANKIV